MSHAQKELVANLLAAWNDHDLERLASFYAPDYRGDDVGQAKQQIGREGLARSAGALMRAFPDIHFTGDIMAEDDRAVLIWQMRGTYTGSLMRIPPTNRVVEFQGVSILTIRDQQIVYGHYIWDVAGFLRAVGLLPALL